MGEVDGVFNTVEFTGDVVEGVTGRIDEENIVNVSEVVGFGGDDIFERPGLLLVTMNYRLRDTDFQKGFIQGIISATTSNDKETTIPKRHIDALKELQINPSITITSSDKGGSVVIMDTTD